MNEPSDEVLLSSARRALADAAPAEPSPAILAAVRRAAAPRALEHRVVGAVLAAAAAAAAILVALAWPVLNARIDHRPHAAVASAESPADAAVRLLLFDAAEARAVLAATSEDGADEESGAVATAEASSGADDADWSSLSFADALLAWQESPLAAYADAVY